MRKNSMEENSLWEEKILWEKTVYVREHCRRKSRREERLGERTVQTVHGEKKAQCEKMCLLKGRAR